MPHDWGVTVPADLPTEQVFEIRDLMRAGTMSVELPLCDQWHEKASEWHKELNAQILAAYEKEAARRLS